MKRLSLRSLLSVSTLALLAAAPSAMAQAPSTLQPQGGWSVTKMEASSNGAGPYCALARQYDKNIIFTLGRNLTDEYSLAVDFQKEQMDPRTAYKLTLSPGAGQTRAFNLMPLSERAMVIRLGWDESFFKALDSSRTLRVGIGDVDYNFNMPDIAAGQKDLQNCIDGLKQSSKSADAKTPDNAAPGDVLNAEASASKGFSARKGEELVVESAEAVPAPEVVASNVTPLPASAGPVQPMPRADGDRALLKQVADLRADNERLMQKLGAQDKKLQESYKNATDSNALAEMQEKLRLLENENKRLASGAAAGTVTAAAAAGAVVKTANAATPDDDKKTAELQSNLSLAQAERAKLQDEVAALRRQVEEARIKATPAPATNASLEAANKRSAEAEAQVQRLTKELADARAQAKVIPAVAQAPVATPAVDAKAEAKAAAENQKLKDQVAALEKQVKEAKLSTAKGTKAAQELAELKNRVIESEKQREQLRVEKEKTAADLKAAQAAQGDKVAAQTQAQTELQAQLAKAQADVKTAQAQAQAAQEALNAAQSTMTSSQDGAKEAQAAAQKAQAEAKAAQDKMAAMEGELRKLRATVALDGFRQAPAPQAQVQAAALNDITPAAGPAAGFDTPPAQKPAKVQEASLTPASKTKAAAPGYDENDVKTLLSRSGLVIDGKVRRMKDSHYAWRTGGDLMGSAEVLPGGDFARKVDDYISKAKAQCKGDFAAIPAAQGADSANVEIACVSDAGSTSASVAFFETDNSFVAVSHEGAAENMERAMDARDQVARAR